MLSGLILLPFFSLIILNLPFRALMRRLSFGLFQCLALAQIILVLSPSVFLSGSSSFGVDRFFKFNLINDNLTRLMLLCIGMVLLVTVFVCRYTIKGPSERFNFINLLLIALIGTNGVVMANDIFSLFVFMEITAVASFILVAFHKKADALEAAFKYIILSEFAAVLMLTAIALLLFICGSASFPAINAALKNSPQNFLIMPAIGIFLCGLFVKAGLVPFHAWLPDAHSAAPAAVSVFLSGLQIKILGAYTAIRLVTSVFGYSRPVTQILMLVGSVSIIFGGLAALRQSDFKRMLAYSSISQVGYIFLGLGSGSALGLLGAVFHLFNHAVFKSLLFVNAAAVEAQAGTRDMDKMSGLAARMPLTGLTSLLAGLSAAGVPPLAGFWSKLIIVAALWISGHYVYAFAAVLGSLITLAYILSLQRRVFFGKIKAEFQEVKEAGFALALPALVLAAITVAVGIIFPFLAQMPKF
ncbi:MAG: proton-conducting transporter membrane subunit [Candidatus Omnitrophota bacterium]